jgi:hypothetical protein
MSDNQKPWLILLCFYFGKWPAWMNFFVESCRWNPDVHWRFYTDCGEPENRAGNIDYVPISFDDYKALARARLGIAFDPLHPYKLCDLRPALGFLHEQDTIGYPYFGYADIDVIYGNIASFYGEERLAEFDIVSTHPERLSGHFAVLRNTPVLRHAFERIPNYRALLELPQQTGVEEAQFSQIFLESMTERSMFVERYSTVLSVRGWHDGSMNYPQRWFWRRGRLTNERDGEREFLYLHFMRWQSAHWINNPPVPGEAIWVGREIIHFDWRRAAADGFCISPEGFASIDQPGLASHSEIHIPSRGS